jgi:hypothetical protein
VDSIPVECGRSCETVKRSDLAGWAQYGYCASYSRYFWGLRLHLVCTLRGLPVSYALTGAKADERETWPQQPDVEFGQLLLEPCPATHPRTDRRHLAQRSHRSADHARPDRLRPLNPLESII